MNKMGFLSGVMVSVLLAGVSVCHAEKWDKNGFEGQGIEAGYYNKDSIKVKKKLVSWTEKYVFTPEGTKYFTGQLAKHPVCKESMVEKGEATQFQVDYQVKDGKFRGAGKRYYNKAGKLICGGKDLEKDLDTSWHVVERGTPIQDAMYDLVTKYKVNFE
jgi:hypothetical protein